MESLKKKSEREVEEIKNILSVLDEIVIENIEDHYILDWNEKLERYEPVTEAQSSKYYLIYEIGRIKLANMT